MGNDVDGVAANYEVAIVHHLPVQPDGLDAELYLRRIYLIDAKKAVAELPQRGGDAARWNDRSWPVIALRSSRRPKPPGKPPAPKRRPPRLRVVR